MQAHLAMQPRVARSQCSLSRTLVLVLCVLCQCQAIRVPVTWGDDKASSQVETFTPVTFQQQSIPVEYFEYKAHKPQFAVDVAAFHGVKNPESHYKSYPVRPYTGKDKPDLGKHYMLDENKEIYRPYQQYVNGNEEWLSHITPTSSSYEVFHPYKAEEPALQEIYKDPVLQKIRDDLENSKNNLQKYESEAGAADIEEGEYLESPEQTDRKKLPQKNIPATFEIHRPLRRPVYYRPPQNAFTHEQILNHKLRHPWNQNFVRVRPVHYRPLKTHLHNLRQHHALKYDDEHNEYPQVPPSENFAEPPDGYDIYLKGQDKYNQLRNNLDESVNKVVLKNRPQAYQRLELQNKDKNEESNEDEFIPIKNYAQVRKTETTKHLPKSAALKDAASYDDIVNAHRLREAVKSTKAQTVYSEEGYEDAAYDHAGEQKHASDHEGHGGFLREKEISGGKFKTPSFNGKYKDASGSVYGDKKQHGEKWKNDDKDKEEKNDSIDYAEDEQSYSEEEDAYGNVPDEDTRHKREHEVEGDEEKESENENPVQNKEGQEQKDDDDHGEGRKKRENEFEIKSTSLNTLPNKNNIEHDLNKREANFEVPEIDITSTFLSKKELEKIAKLKVPKTKKNNLRTKYPYYFTNLKSVPKDSPLRYSENLKFIPTKSPGGTEFYDSRSHIECAEVDDDVDPVPEKIKNNGTDTSDNENDETTNNNNQKFDSSKNKKRLKGLGDKIDCFKAKYFGKNPLDSPFFKEDIIANPKPIKIPKLESYKLNVSEKLSSAYLKAPTDFTNLWDELSKGTVFLQGTITNTSNELHSSLTVPDNVSQLNNTQQLNVYADILKNMKNNVKDPLVNDNRSRITVNDRNGNDSDSITKIFSKNRRKRATPFVYEPYKIIREGQLPESKKTTTTGNISPLIKQLQSSKVVEKVLGFNNDKIQPVKRNVKTRTYKDINRQDREKNAKQSDSSFIDVNVDRRRGEPRYEFKPSNHKTQYTPVDHKKSMSIEDYESQTNSTIAPSRYRKALKPKLEDSTYPQSFIESAASKTVRKVVSTTSTPKVVINSRTETVPKHTDNQEDEEEYDEYEDDEEEIITTTTTIKPSFRRRRPTTTTDTPHFEHEEEEISKKPKLRMTTRFNKPHAIDSPIGKEKYFKNNPSVVSEDDGIDTPKYREKKKKSRKSTLVTDTKSYGEEDDDDMRQDEVDALIGVKQDMDDYIPQYEKEADAIMDSIKERIPDSSEEDEEDEENDDSDEKIEEDEDEDEDSEDEDDNDEDEGEDDMALEVSKNDAKKIEELNTEKIPESVILTTPEPTKRSLIRTTEALPSTTEARIAKLRSKPVIRRKKVEIHKELPVNTTAPHVTQFKQDIQEVEIIKELPQKRRKPTKNLEALELFKDEKLAEEINKLKDVEIFKENLELNQGPRHGGNYKREEKSEALKSSTPNTLRSTQRGAAKKDVVKTSKESINDAEDTKLQNKHGGHLKPTKKYSRPNDNEASNAKHIELSDDERPLALHGGNLRSIQDKYKSRGNNRNAKIIELDDEYDSDDDSSETHRDNSQSYHGPKPNGGYHGGNYRSAKIVQAEPINDTTDNKDKQTLQARSKQTKGNRNNAAALLDGYAKVVPILTTTPNYILDPSKRMYYYVDA